MDQDEVLTEQIPLQIKPIEAKNIAELKGDLPSEKAAIAEKTAIAEKATKAGDVEPTLQGTGEIKKVMGNDIQRKFVINFKKGQDEQAQLLTQKIAEISDSPIGNIPFEDIVLYLFREKLEQSDFDQIRSNAFERKMDIAKEKYNKENKTNYTMQEFLAAAMEEYLT